MSVLETWSHPSVVGRVPRDHCGPCTAPSCSSRSTRPPQEAINHTWFGQCCRGHDSCLAIVLPSLFCPGPWAVLRSCMEPMGTEDCGQTQEMCQGLLKPGSQYR